MKKVLWGLSIISVFFATQAGATPFGFAADPGTLITQGYQGFNYTGGESQGSWVNDTQISIHSIYGIGPTALGAAWSNGGTPLTLTSSTAGQLFDIGSLSLNAGSTETVTLQGLLNGSVVDSWAGTITNQFSYTGVTLNWTGIDQLNFSGGANLFVTNIDTLTTAPVPEPETYAMLMAGLGLMGVAARRRKAKSA
jgi:hypothetical protein